MRGWGACNRPSAFWGLGAGGLGLVVWGGHGVVPWWTEAYAIQKEVSPHIPHNTWFGVRVDLVNDEMTLYVEDEIILTKKLTYYLSEGRPGLYVGTATDAAFRRIVIKDLL